jgi:hypothetical protein
MGEGAADAVDWAQGQRTTMAAFLARYTLHDSAIDQVIFSADGSAQLTVAWDPVWLERPFAQAGLPPPTMRHYALYLKFVHVLGARIDDFLPDEQPFSNGTIAGANTQLLSVTQRADLRDALELLRDTETSTGRVRREPAIPDGAYCTVVHTIFGADIVLYHTGEVIALCYDPDGQIIHLPGLTSSPGDAP